MSAEVQDRTKTELPPVATPKALAVRPVVEADKIARQDNGPQGYEGASTGTTTKEENDALMAPFAEEAYEIKPTEAGEVYVSQTHIRRRLNQVFGALGWALIPIPTDDGKLFSRDGTGDREVVLMRGRLYVRGHFRSDHIGEQALSHDRMTYATACEAAQSDTLTRCAKDLSIGWECWDKRWCDAWRSKFAVRVMVKKGKGEARIAWRRKDAAKLYGEIAVDADPAAIDGDIRQADPVITDAQYADLWALATEKLPRQKAREILKGIIQAHGFKDGKHITAAKLPAIVAAVTEAGA
jgi:genome maintenance protein MGM101